MKTHRFPLALILGSVLILTPAIGAGQAQTASKTSLKLKGGYGWSQVGDWNTFITHWYGWNRDYAQAAGWQFSGQMKEVHLGPDFSLEMLYALSPSLKFGLEAGYLSIKKDGTENQYTVSSKVGTGSVQRSEWTDIKAFPLRLTGYWTVPLGGGARFLVGAGAGLYYTRFNGETHFDYENATWFRRQTKAGALGCGLHGSLGLEIDLAKSIGIFVEAMGRYAKISGFKGTLSWADSDEPLGSQEGTLYYYEQLQLDWNNWVYLQATAPEGESYRNVRKAIIDLTGGTARAGIFIRF